MEESSLFMQWAINMLQQEHPAPDVDGGSGRISAPAAMDHGVWPLSPDSARHGLAGSSSGGATNLPVISWNFGASSAQPASGVGTLRAAATRGLPGLAYAAAPPPPPPRRASFKNAGSLTSSYAQEHIMSERKRREKINQRFVELSAVIPGLTKMDKATILSDATRYVKEIQEKVRALEAAGGGDDVRSTDAVVVVKKPCHASSGAPAAERKPLPDIEARFSEKSVTVRIHCENGKGVVVRVLAEVEELPLRIVDADVLPFPASTLIIAVTAKVQEGFTITAEDIIGRLNSALSPFT
ncbi:hypothetical protein ACP70R_014288 [Stipagrostis hirtigluma subsp. patula]